MTFNIFYGKNIVSKRSYSPNSTKCILVKNIALKTVLSGSTEKSSTSTDLK